MALLAAAAPSSRATGAPDPPPPAAAAAPITQDAALYADAYELRPEEAARRLALQGQAQRLEDRLEAEIPEAYAGLYLRHAPAFAVVVRLAGVPTDAPPNAAPHTSADGSPEASADALTERLAADSGLGAALEILPAEVTIDELRAQQQQAARAASAPASVRTPGSVPDTAIDVRENRVEVLAEEAPPSGSPLDRAAADPGLRVSVVENPGEILPAAPSSGGEAISTKSRRLFCTKGFSVRPASASGASGTATAAHCPNRLFDGPDRLPLRAQSLGGSTDAQWHKTPKAKDPPRIRTRGGSHPGYRPITGTLGRDAQPVGSWVCKFGARTKKTCGTISGKWYAPGYVPNARATFVGVASSRPVVLPGDSGGPFYAGTLAYGTTAAYSRSGSTYYGYYMPVDYLANLGVRVKVAR